MGQNIDYSVVEANVSAMKDIATKIETCKMAMNYYSYGAIDTEGEFASSFEQMKSMVQKTVGDIESFISGYANLIDSVAKNYEALDSEMKQHIIIQNGIMV